MLNFIPMHRKATILRQTDVLDDWGQPTRLKIGTYKCQIDFTTGFNRIQANDGFQKTINGTILFHGKVDIQVGDITEFGKVNSAINPYLVHEVYYSEDYSGKIIATRVVVGNGKRY